MNDVKEIFRLPAPGPRPLGIAADGTQIWLGSLDSEHLYSMDRSQWAPSQETAAPGQPFGIAVVGDELRVVVGEGEADDRYIYRFVPGRGFKEKIACPEMTGSHLAYDGEMLFLSQAHDGRILELNEQGGIVREIRVGRGVFGIVIVEGQFHVLTGESAKHTGVLTRVDVRHGEPVIEDLATIPFIARGLAFDGTRFWTNHSSQNETVAFEI